MITSQLKGTLLKAATAQFEDEHGKDVTYGKVQVLTPDMSGNFLSIQNVKVKTENFGLIADLKPFHGKEVVLNLSTNEYKGKVNYFLESIATLNKAA